MFENIAANPQSNYASINNLYSFDRANPQQPLISDTDLAALGSPDASGNNWSIQPGHTPNVDFEYANGTHDGQAYLNTRRANYALIGGSQMVRERFTVAGGNRVVTSMMVRVNRQSGSGLLRAPSGGERRYAHRGARHQRQQPGEHVGARYDG